MNRLLIPRYQIISDYPGNQLEVGYILTCPSYDNEFSVKYWCEMFDKYPKIYKKLQWYENRNNSEMPLYVKDNISGIVRKVYKHFTYIMLSGSMIGEHDVETVCSFDEVAVDGHEMLFWGYDCCLPSSEKEFLEQIPLS